MAIKILDVGQCGFDGPRMAQLWREKLGATVVCKSSGQEAADELDRGDFDLVLVNRVLAASGASGLEVIEELLEQKKSQPIMLVSDLPEAQDAAVALGAIRGFGKAELGDPATLKLVADVASGKKK